MVDDTLNVRRCRMCKELWSEPIGGLVYCPYLNQKVWADSLMCKHGEDLLDCF